MVGHVSDYPLSAKRAVTIKDIARELKLSTQTVATALADNRSTTRVSEQTRAMVREVAQRLNYRASSSARNLRRRENRRVGVIVEKLSQHPHLAMVRLGSLIAVDELFTQRGYSSQLLQEDFAAWDPARPPDYLREITHAGYMLYSCSPEVDERVIAVFEQYRLPWIVLNGPPQRANSLAIDNRRAAFDATDYLLGLGHRSILHVMPNQPHHSAAQRRLGYDEAMRARGMVPHYFAPEWDGMRVLREPQTRAPFLATVREGRFTAILCYNDVVAWFVNQCLNESGLVVPRDISLVGIGDAPGTNFCNPPLTTMTLGYHTLGERAAEALLRRIAEPEVSLHFEPSIARLVKRGSVRELRAVT